MTLKLHAAGKNRRKTDIDMCSAASWDNTIETLAMTLCPVKEWQRYEQQVQRLAWRANYSKNAAGSQNPLPGKVKVFPIWRKYRHKATKIAYLYQAVPVLRHLPLRVTGFLSEVLLK